MEPTTQPAARWVRLCTLAEAPAEQSVTELIAEDKAICLARVEGVLHAVDNLCPHRQGPLGQGWIEGGAVVCPWHSWAFNLVTGCSEYPENHQVAAFPLRVEAGIVLIQLSPSLSAGTSDGTCA